MTTFLFCRFFHSLGSYWVRGPSFLLMFGSWPLWDRMRGAEPRSSFLPGKKSWAPASSSRGGNCWSYSSGTSLIFFVTSSSVSWKSLFLCFMTVTYFPQGKKCHRVYLPESGQMEIGSKKWG